MEIFTIVTWKIWKQQNGHILQGGNHFFWDKKGLGDELLLQAQIQKDSLSI